MKRKHKILSYTCFLILLILFAIMLPMGTSAANTDYSKPGATEKITLDSADIVEHIMRSENPDFTLSDAERAYLSQFGTESVSYSAEISYLDNVISAYDESTDVLIVTAFVYEYLTLTEFPMRWVPYSANIGDREILLTQKGEEYSATIEGAFSEGLESVKILYKTELSFSSKVANLLLNKAHNDAIEWDEYEKYLVRLGEYNAALNAYNAYLLKLDEYEKRYAEYSIYQKELAEYEKAFELYQKYEADLKEYNEKYALYRQYLDDKVEYDKNVILYNKYVENSAKVTDQLAIIEGTKKNSVVIDKNTLTPMSRQLYGAITGKTVSEVLDNKSLISGDLTGIDGSVVDEASISTENLRELLNTYFSFETEEEKYSYYALNYEKFKTNFISLFRTLDLFYNNSKVRAGLSSQGMKQKYEVLLAQLFFTVNAISDEPVLNYNGTSYYNASYQFEGKTPISILEGAIYIEDKNNATPIEGGYPTVVEKPTITEVTEPVKPTVVKRPIQPEAVEAPGERPAALTRPRPIANMDPPFALSDPHSLPESVVALVSEYRSGKIKPRESKTATVKIEVGVYSTKKFKNADEIIVRFFDEGGNQLGAPFNIERGSFLEYGGNAPEKAEDDYAIYRFIGWKNGAGDDAERVDMSSVNCPGIELNLYPLFEITEKLYKVCWDIDGNITYTYEPLGVIPTPPVEPAISVDEHNTDGFKIMRVFSGWGDQNGNVGFAEVKKNEEENVYYALYTPITFVSLTDKYGESQDATIFLNNGIYSVDCTEDSTNEINIGTLTDYAAGRGSVCIKTDEYEIFFSDDAVLKMSELGVVSLGLEQSFFDTRDCFTVRLILENGSCVQGEVSADIILPWSFSDPDNMELYYVKDGVRTAIKRTVLSDESGSTLSARVYCGVEYIAVTEYIVDLIPSDVISLGIDSTVLCEGQQLEITYNVPNGVSVTSVYMLLDDGERVELLLSDDGIIEVSMPPCRVSIGAEIKYLEYKISFVSGTVVISERTYRYGEMPIPPADPKKASDGVYTYEFVGWDKEICLVGEDAVYTAVYESTLIPPKEEETGLQLSDSVWNLIHEVMRKAVPLAIVIVILLPVSIVSAIIVIVSLSKKRRGQR